jgi:hypothetical protein
MRFRIVRLNLLVGIQLAEPFLLLPKLVPDVAEKFYRALSPRHNISLNDMQTAGGNSFGDVKLTINVYGGSGKIDITPSGLITDLRNLVQTADDLKAIRDYLVTCEQTLIAAIGKNESPVDIRQRDIRASVWIECEEGPDAAERWLAERGQAALSLDPSLYQEMHREFTLQVHLVDKEGRGRMGVGIQKSLVDFGHLYLVCEHQTYRKEETLVAVDANFDKAYADLEGLLRAVGLEPAQDNV